MPKDEPTQHTEQGYEIPVPKRDDVLAVFRRSAQPIVAHQDEPSPRDAFVPPTSPRKLRKALSRRKGNEKK